MTDKQLKQLTIIDLFRLSSMAEENGCTMAIQIVPIRKPEHLEPKTSTERDGD